MGTELELGTLTHEQDQTPQPVTHRSSRSQCGTQGPPVTRPPGVLLKCTFLGPTIRIFGLEPDNLPFL